ncbi:hypothetical protein [Fluviicola taffensis]|uniref:hypothetical protein n=1 Tax=Fluviicola taffensis TaxID=191579 RepID=UPI0031380017
MKKLILITAALLVTTFSYSQISKRDSTLKVLDDYMSTHIPDMNSGISEFKNTLSGTILITKIFLFDDEPYSKEFELKNAEIKIEKLKVDRESAKAYGFKYYWEISIGESWLLSSIEDQKVAQRIAEILTDLKSIVEKGK